MKENFKARELKAGNSLVVEQNTTHDKTEIFEFSEDGLNDLFEIGKRAARSRWVRQDCDAQNISQEALLAFTAHRRTQIGPSLGPNTEKFFMGFVRKKSLEFHRHQEKQPIQFNEQAQRLMNDLMRPFPESNEEISPQQLGVLLKKLSKTESFLLREHFLNQRLQKELAEQLGCSNGKVSGDVKQALKKACELAKQLGFIE